MHTLVLDKIVFTVKCTMALGTWHPPLCVTLRGCFLCIKKKNTQNKLEATWTNVAVVTVINQELH